MKNIPLILLSLIMFVLLGGCDRGTSRQKQESPFNLNALIENLAQRQAWDANEVKIWLESPVVVLRQTNGMILEAWPDTENDYNVPMIRVDQGQRLYQISTDEYVCLQQMENAQFPRKEN